MKEFRLALKLSIPIFFAYIFLGIAFGILMTEANYSPLTTVLCSVFIFAGSMQIVMVPLLQSGAPFYAIAIMTFFINARHIFYGVGFIERFRKSGWRFPYQIFSLTDETYSILCSAEYPPDYDVSKTDFFVASINQSYWILGSFLGAIAGNYLPFDLAGIEFSATAFFLVVVIDQLRQYPSKIPVLTGLISALVFYLILGPDYFLIPALSISMVSLVLLRDIVSVRMKLEEKKS